MPQSFDSRLDELQNLLQHLPASLPFDPPSSSYHFHLSEEDIEDRGIFGALSRCLEISFGQHRDGTILFNERAKDDEDIITGLDGLKESDGFWAGNDGEGPEGSDVE
ncbi:hypothetical protein D9757_011243 [Collybiopsis confluens]|uniref:Uncharacterized protein n=1 Tax=Collybiopsis confluens TaxID=2823264 RepID=A0A8H5GN81_9AGAR|nr:hypothetical protein D9757_011243 [Collybiopsis confluens]